MFIVIAPENQRLFTTRMALDLSAPEVGDEVAVLAHQLGLERIDEVSGTISRQVQMRLGVVTNVTFGPARMKQSFCFETTIPIPAGFSGGPIVKKPQHGAEVVACGVVSFDLSSPEAFSSFLVAGNSTSAMLWPAMGLGLRAALPGAEPKTHLLGDLVHPNLIINRASDVEVSAIQVENAVRIQYLDKRKTPPEGHVLSTTSLPEMI